MQGMLSREFKFQTNNLDNQNGKNINVILLISPLTNLFEFQAILETDKALKNTFMIIDIPSLLYHAGLMVQG